MQNQFPSLITANAGDGLTLALSLAGRLHAQIEQAGEKVERPGGMNYLQSMAVPREITAGILFYAIAAANRGWPEKIQPLRQPVSPGVSMAG